MNSRSQTLTLTLLRCCLCGAKSTLAADVLRDASLVDPDVIMRHADQLGLSQEQLQDIREEAQAGSQKSQQLQQESAEATGELAKLLAADKVEEEAALKLLDVVLEIEKQVIRGHDAAGEEVTAHPIGRSFRLEQVRQFPMTKDMNE